MEKRYFIALLLAAAVVALTQILFPVPRPNSAVSNKAGARTFNDTGSRAAVAAPQAPAPAKTVAPVAADSTAALTPAATRPEITTLATMRSEYRFTNIGAAPLSVSLRDYRNLSPAGGNVVLKSDTMPLLRYALVVNGDTVRLDRTPFVPHVVDNDDEKSVTYDADVAGAHVTISYAPSLTGYSMKARGTVQALSGKVFLLTQLPSTFRPAEADTVADFRNLAVSFKRENENARIIGFGSLDPGEQRLETGPLTWAAVKSKYFVLGVLNPTGSSFNEITLRGGPRTTKLATNAIATTVSLIRNGTFSFDIYAGPQQATQLGAMGRDFNHVNPYGWRFLQGVVQPIAELCIRLLLWMHSVLKLNYGWVLIIFGVMIRIALWPLNQSAMRSSLKMQEIQPKLQAVQQKYKDKPEKQREEIMKVYRDAGASPFTALTGCLPALIPMPVLFALFFVFQNTIEFRGVPFLWLHDISIKDPLFILPVLMGISMYVLSWIGLRNAPPNPQAKMMSYMFPVMMTFILANMASGLNLYYTAQNIAALPQQWLIANERARKARPT
jgi:YidC/Oxa1 family membrane protein insertase